MFHDTKRNYKWIKKIHCSLINEKNSSIKMCYVRSNAASSTGHLQEAGSVSVVLWSFVKCIYLSFVYQTNLCTQHKNEQRSVQSG